jgi:outer membrane protein OmpA-like peptidoglycan-associated protein
MQGHGINGSRLTHQGFGPEKPLATNDTEEGRAQNRRTEFVIVSR